MVTARNGIIIIGAIEMYMHNLSDYHLRDASTAIEKMQKEVKVFKERIATTNKVEFFISCYFDATENYCWIADLYLILYVEPIKVRENFTDDRIQIEVKQYRFCKEPPIKILEKLNEIKSRDNLSCEIRFIPEEWVFEKDTRFPDGRLDWWKRCPKV
jgi:hypothetical protein